MNIFKKVVFGLFGCSLVFGGSIVCSSAIKNSASAAGEAITYTKVTSEPVSWAGNYLIVYETGNKVFNSSAGSDASSAAVDVTIKNGKIEGTYSDYEVTIGVNGGYTLITSKGKYLSGTKGSNGTTFGTSVKNVTISFNDGNVFIVSDEMTFSFNDQTGQNRFRFFKNGGQKPVQLYKAGEAKTVSSITIESNPSKTSYKEGEFFDASGLSLKVVYSDESSETITDGFTYSDEALTAGTTSIEVEFGGKTVDVDIIVYALTGLRSEGSLVKTEYNEGQDFDPTGLTIYADYDGTTSDVVTDKVEWSALKQGETSVVGTFGGKTITINGLTVKAPIAYTLVTDASTLKSGDQLVFAFAKADKNYHNGVFNKNLLTAVEYTPSNGMIPETDDIVPITLSGSATGWKFAVDGGVLTATGSSNNNMNITENGNNSLWTIAISEGAATIRNVGITAAYLRTNTDAPRFTVYGSSSNIIINFSIYRKAGASTDDAISSVTLSNSTKQNITLGNTLSLSATVEGGIEANTNIVWSSSVSDAVSFSKTTSNSDETITITTLKACTTTIKAAAEGDDTVYDTVELTIVDPNAVSEVKIDKEIIGFTVRPTCNPIQLTATALPEGVSQDVTWSSSDETIATVSASGLVTPQLNHGVVTVTATSTKNSAAKAETTVIVFSKKGQEKTAIELDEAITMIDYSYSPSETFDSDPYDIYVKGRVISIDKEFNGSSISVTLTTEDGKNTVTVPSLVMDTESAVDGTSVKAGSIITIAANESQYTNGTKGYKISDATCYGVDNSDLGIKSIKISGGTTVKAGKDLQLKATLIPSYTEDTLVEWSSSDETTATVSNTGCVTGVKAGTATITVKSKNNVNVKDSVTVTVTSASSYAGVYTLTSGTTTYTPECNYYGVTSLLNGYDEDILLFYEGSMSFGCNPDIDDISLDYNESISFCVTDAGNYMINEIKFIDTRSNSSDAIISVEGDGEVHSSHVVTNEDSTFVTYPFGSTITITSQMNRTFIGAIEISIVAATDTEALINSYANDILDTTAPTCSAMTGDFKNTWDDLYTAFINISLYNEGLINTFKSGSADESGNALAKALARYDYIYTKYATSLDLENFLDRSVTPLANPTMAIINNSGLIALIAVSSLVLVSSYGVLLCLKKRKHQ